MLKFTAYRAPVESLAEIKNSNAVLRYYLDCNEKAQKLFTQEFCKKVVKEIDKSEIVSLHSIVSPFLGNITPKELSGGVSTILALYFLCNEGRADFFFDSAHMGDNCVPYLMEIIDKYDVVMWMTTPIKITDSMFKKYSNKVYSLDENRFINSSADFRDTYLEWEHKLLCDIAKEDEELFDEEWEKFDEEIAERDLRRALGEEEY